MKGESLTELLHSSQTFIVDPASTHHARLLSETETVQGKSTTRVYSYMLTQARGARSIERAVLQENVTITGYDGHESSSQSSQDLYSGLMVTEQTDEQMRIAFAHDALGRVVQEVAAPDSAFEAKVNWAYSLSANERCQTRIGASGRKETVWLNGMGREVRRETQTDSGETYTAWTGEYDVLGRVFRETAYDPGNKDTPPLALTTQRTFDDWSNVLTETSADGVTQHTLADPVALTGTSWQTDANGVAGAKTVTTHTLDGKPLTEQLYSADGVLQHELGWSYDGLGRCISQTDAMVEVQTQEWRQDGKLSKRELNRDGVLVRSETFDYDIRGRMIAHRLTGPSLPEDAHGRSYREQHFQYDALDNVRRLETVFADGSESNVSVFGYNPSDLTQLINISHSRPDYPAPVTLEYDALGNLIRDERGNPLHYDALGRLIGVTLPTGQRRWHYGPGGNIIKTEDAAGPRWRYHTSGQLSCEVGESTQTRWVRAGNVPVAESRLASAVREVMLLGTDAQGSVTTEAKDQIQTPVYGAYGQSTTEPGASRLGYAGALREQDTGWYFLGDYRIYNPVLMRFHSRDSLSPFGEGGLNGYAYCAGDPVNRIDPSGHAWTDWLLPAAGLVLGMIGTVASLGALAAPAAALTASYVAAVTTATLSVVSLAADVASIVLLTSGNENAGRILGYVGMATGLASAAPSIASAAARKVKEFGKVVGSGQYRLQHAGGRGQGFPGSTPRAGSSEIRLDQLTREALPAQDLHYVRQHFAMPSNLVDRRFFAEMPAEVMRNIVGRLPGSDLVSLSQTSRDIHQTVQRTSRPLNLPTLHGARHPANRPYVDYVQQTWLGNTAGVLPEQITNAGISPYSTTTLRMVADQHNVPAQFMNSSWAYEATLRSRNTQALARVQEAQEAALRLRLP